MNAHNLLKQQIIAVHPIDEQAWDELARRWTEVSYKRKQVITMAGETEKYLYLVLDGVQRAFFEHDGKEATLVFSYPPSFSGIIDSFFTQQPSKFCLETITQSSLLRIHFNDLDSLMQKHRSIETWVRVALTGVLSGTLQRQVEIMSYSAEEKFTTLLHRSPHVLNLIPHKYLASYIGVDPTTFSKLLGKVKL
ncbi:Crp/Fnr family transcriptional regulator [Polluticoccus soli]|uniref:Crp/Fnr family transcriptional regulator n=1 Tax=Polluticoccus soli TaxID=3034150 RepID=UPI0023E2A671|nr:Crp/Fnr family transcriptional regulator [Flavipsychrobacter sp. JY13-12]